MLVVEDEGMGEVLVVEGEGMGEVLGVVWVR